MKMSIPDSRTAAIYPPCALPADERRPWCGKAGALSKTEEQVVMGNIKKTIPGGLMLALEPAVEQVDAGVVE
jgi:hypothetical protein